MNFIYALCGFCRSKSWQIYKTDNLGSILGTRIAIAKHSRRAKLKNFQLQCTIFPNTFHPRASGPPATLLTFYFFTTTLMHWLRLSVAHFFRVSQLERGSSQWKRVNLRFLFNIFACLKRVRFEPLVNPPINAQGVY